MRKIKTYRCYRGFIIPTLLLGTAAQLMAAEGYKLDITTGYQFGNPPGSIQPFGGAAPDSGWWMIANNGSSVFAGTVGQNAISGGGGNFDYSTPVTLNPGDSITVVVNNESSNYGGFNGPTGSTQNGVEIFLNGLINGVEAVNLSVFDKDIHSGVFQTNPFGVSLDNYVLQGGDPLGRDTGDAFEVNQAQGHFTFFEARTTPGVPDAGASLGLLGIGLAGLIGFGRRSKKS